jgi:hypothetical protein
MPLCNTSSTNHHLTFTALLNVPDYTMATLTDEILCNFFVVGNLFGIQKHLLVVGLYKIRHHWKFLGEPVLVNEKSLSFSDHAWNLSVLMVYYWQLGQLLLLWCHSAMHFAQVTMSQLLHSWMFQPTHSQITQMNSYFTFLWPFTWSGSNLTSQTARSLLRIN